MITVFYFFAAVIYAALFTYISYKYNSIFTLDFLLKSPWSFSYGILFFALLIIELLQLDDSLSSLILLATLFFVAFSHHQNIFKGLWTAAILWFMTITLRKILIYISGEFHLMLFNPPRFNSMVGLFMMDILIFSAVLIIELVHSLIKKKPLILTYWIATLATPISSLYLLVFSLVFPKSNIIMMLLISVIFLIIINVSAVYCYDRTSKYLNTKNEAETALYHNKLYESQLNIMRASNMKIRSVKHDINNHLAAISLLINNGAYDKAKEYITSLTSELESEEKISRTGNIVVDSLVNYKYLEAESNNIRISCDIVIPEEINISHVDLTAIIGNLFDNAIEACLKVSTEKRWISLFMKYDKGRLIIKVSNSFNGYVEKESSKFKSTKPTSSEHGIGLDNVIAAVHKYDGDIDIFYNSNEFTVKLFMYIDII